MTMRRLSHEFKQLRTIPDVVADASLLDDELMHWEVTLIGPPGTPYQNGKFKLEIFFTSDHPFRPPKIKFKTKIFHPNISQTGNICIDILKTEWSPALGMCKVLLSISSLLNDPNVDDPLVQEIADLLIENKKKYIEKARQWTIEFAM